MSNQTLPVFVRREADSLSDIYFPGDREYKDIMIIIEKVSKDFFMSFEEAAEILGYELGSAHKFFA